MPFLLVLAALLVTLALPGRASAKPVAVPGLDRLTAYKYEKLGEKHSLVTGAVELETLTIDLESWLTQSQLVVNPGTVELNTSWLATFSVVSNLAPQILNG